MSWQVYKFGGSSLGTPGRLPQVLELITRVEGPLAIVVSALGDTTDWLISAAREAASGDRPAAERHVVAIDARDFVVTDGTPQQAIVDVDETGQRLRALLAAGHPAPGHSKPGQVEQRIELARIRAVETAPRETEAAHRWVITGFLGRSRLGHTTTLGRNGSDYTASLVAQALTARQVTVWTDVPGVFTADPALVPEAYPVAKLSYSEAVELAHFGTRMFHARTMTPLLESGAVLRIGSTVTPDAPGTLVDAQGETRDDHPTSVTSLEQLALISLEARRSSLPSGLVARALEALDDADLKVWMTNHAGLGVSASFVVSMADAAKAHALLSALRGDEVTVRAVKGPVTLVTLVAERMGHHPNVAGRFFHALGNVGINVLAIAQGGSQRSISCVVDAADTASAVRTVHAAFNFAEAELHAFLLGHGTVGSKLLAQLASLTESLRAKHGVRLKLVGVADSQRTLFDAHGLDPELAVRRLKAEPCGSSAGTETLLPRLGRLPLPVLVDCTAAAGMESLYRRAFARGIHVVAANKKALALPWAQREALMQSAKEHSRAYLYETTCGASLPVIETLKNLVRTGDEVFRIEGSLSGTLGYLCDTVMRGASLSAAVQSAKEKGLTEPHPRDDLSGLDVARKALILVRELGAPLEIEDIAIEPFVTSDALHEDDPTLFLKGLQALDKPFEQRLQQYRRAGLTLRYLAQIEAVCDSFKARVGPIGVPADHPSASLRGEEAMVAFTTRRYREYPLIVRGAGAGGEVTAAGVLADILRLAHSIRGRR